MADQIDQNIFQWVVGGIAAVGASAIAFIARSESSGRAKLEEDVKDIRERYVRRDDLANVLDSYRRGHEELLSEVRSVRTHVHDIANQVSALQGHSGMRFGPK